jgi:hypothetical protein
MESVNYIFANTGQVVRLIVQTFDGSGNRIDLDGYGLLTDGYGGYILDGYSNYILDGYDDGYTNPIVVSVMLPDSTLAPGYPVPMLKIGTGLYSYALQLGSGVSGLGSYVASAFWTESTGESDEIGGGTATLVDGYAVVILPDGVPSNAIITWSRLVSIGVPGDITIMPGSQTTTEFALMSSSPYDNSIVNWVWISRPRPRQRWETFVINASRPFGLASVSPI